MLLGDLRNLSFVTHDSCVTGGGGLGVMVVRMLYPYKVSVGSKFVFCFVEQTIVVRQGGLSFFCVSTSRSRVCICVSLWSCPLGLV